MSKKVDWAKLEQEELANKFSNVEISNEEKDEIPKENSENDDFNAAEASLLRKVIRKWLVITENDIEIQRQNPNSPVYSIKMFEALNLNPNLLKGVYDMGFNTPSKIQEIVLPTLLADPPQNLIAQSQSGTGKTAAFVLAMLSRVDPLQKYPQVLCLSPTYELAIQTGEVATHMAKFCPEIKMKYAVRGEEVARGTHLTEHIIIGTPGKVLDWALKFRVFDLKKLKVFVLNEADVMLDTMGHQDQCIRIHKNLRQSCQMMFSAATYDPDIMDFAEIIVSDPIIIRLKLPITITRAERSFSKLKIVKNYLRSSIFQERLKDLSLLSIEQCNTSDLDLQSVIDVFATAKARKKEF